MANTRHAGLVDLTAAEKRNLIDCWRCDGSGKGNVGKVCPTCKGHKRVVSQLGLVAEAMEYQISEMIKKQK